MRHLLESVAAAAAALLGDEQEHERHHQHQHQQEQGQQHQQPANFLLLSLRGWVYTASSSPCVEIIGIVLGVGTGWYLRQRNRDHERDHRRRRRRHRGRRHFDQHHGQLVPNDPRADEMAQQQQQQQRHDQEIDTLAPGSGSRSALIVSSSSRSSGRRDNQVVSAADRYPNGVGWDDGGIGGGESEEWERVALSERLARGVPVLAATWLWQLLNRLDGPPSRLDPLAAVLSWIFLEMLILSVPSDVWNTWDLGATATAAEKASGRFLLPPSGTCQASTQHAIASASYLAQARETEAQRSSSAPSLTSSRQPSRIVSSPACVSSGGGNNGDLGGNGKGVNWENSVEEVAPLTPMGPASEPPLRRAGARRKSVSTLEEVSTRVRMAVQEEAGPVAGAGVRREPAMVDDDGQGIDESKRQSPKGPNMNFVSSPPPRLPPPPPAFASQEPSGEGFGLNVRRVGPLHECNVGHDGGSGRGSGRNGGKRSENGRGGGSRSSSSSSSSGSDECAVAVARTNSLRRPRTVVGVSNHAVAVAAAAAPMANSVSAGSGGQAQQTPPKRRRAPSLPQSLSPQPIPKKQVTTPSSSPSPPLSRLPRLPRLSSLSSPLPIVSSWSSSSPSSSDRKEENENVNPDADDSWRVPVAASAAVGGGNAVAVATLGSGSVSSSVRRDGSRSSTPLSTSPESFVTLLRREAVAGLRVSKNSCPSSPEPFREIAARSGGGDFVGQSGDCTSEGNQSGDGSGSGSDDGSGSCRGGGAGSKRPHAGGGWWSSPSCSSPAGKSPVAKKGKPMVMLATTRLSMEREARHQPRRQDQEDKQGLELKEEKKEDDFGGGDVTREIEEEVRGTSEGGKEGYERELSRRTELARTPQRQGLPQCLRRGPNSQDRWAQQHTVEQARAHCPEEQPHGQRYSPLQQKHQTQQNWQQLHQQQHRLLKRHHQQHTQDYQHRPEESSGDLNEKHETASPAATRSILTGSTPPAAAVQPLLAEKAEEEVQSSDDPDQIYDDQGKKEAEDMQEQETGGGWESLEPLISADLVRGGEPGEGLGQEQEGTPMPAEFRPPGLELDVLCNWNLKHMRKDEDVGMFARGAFGKVLAARTERGVQIAVKMVDKSDLSPDRYIERELELLEESSVHPHVVGLLGVIRTPDRVYVLMPLADTDLAAMIKTTRLDEKQAGFCVRQVVSAVEFLHGRGIVHRDIKPANILVLCNKVLLADFGLAKEIPERQREIFGTCGTKPYLAPELVRDLPYDESVDLWAIGVVTFELLHGYTPFCPKLVLARSWDGLLRENRKRAKSMGRNSSSSKKSVSRQTNRGVQDSIGSGIRRTASGFPGSSTSGNSLSCSYDTYDSGSYGVSESSGSIVNCRMFERSAPAGPGGGLDRAWLMGQVNQALLNGMDDSDEVEGVALGRGGGRSGGRGGRRGYSRANQLVLLDNIARGKFSVRKDWVGSAGADFISQLLHTSPARRMSAARAAEHDWLGNPAKVPPRRRAARAEVAAITAERAAGAAERHKARVQSLSNSSIDRRGHGDGQVPAATDVMMMMMATMSSPAATRAAAAALSAVTDIAHLAAAMAAEVRAAQDEAKRWEKAAAAAASDTKYASSMGGHGSSSSGSISSSNSSNNNNNSVSSSNSGSDNGKGGGKIVEMPSSSEEFTAAVGKAEAAVQRGELMAKEAMAGAAAAAAAADARMKAASEEAATMAAGLAANAAKKTAMLQERQGVNGSSASGRSGSNCSNCSSGEKSSGSGSGGGMDGNGCGMKAAKREKKGAEPVRVRPAIVGSPLAE